MEYTAQLLDGGNDAGETTLLADDIEEAFGKAAEWASKGDWHTAGSVVCVITDDEGTEERRDVSVPQTSSRD